MVFRLFNAHTGSAASDAKPFAQTSMTVMLGATRFPTTQTAGAVLPPLPPAIFDHVNTFGPDLPGATLTRATSSNCLRWWQDAKAIASPFHCCMHACQTVRIRLSHRKALQSGQNNMAQQSKKHEDATINDQIVFTPDVDKQP